MSSFSFNNKFATFGSTCVENMFIIEEMPHATGECVKVYLYGLFVCHHQEKMVTVEEFAKDLGMDVDAVQKCFSYWEKRHLVWRTSDNPPSYEFASCMERMISGEDIMEDTDYSAFSRQMLQQIEGDKWYTEAKMSRCYEWHSDMGLPTEVVAALVRNVTANGTKQMPVKETEKRAAILADAHAETAEEAEEILNRDRNRHLELKKLLRKLGQNREPSDFEEEMYRKWTMEYGMTPEAVTAAAKNTVKGSPNLSYLDGIITNMRKKAGNVTTERDVLSLNESGAEERIALQNLLAIFSDRDTAVNDDRLKLFRHMRQLYTDDIITLAAKCCVRYSDVKDMTELENSLIFWKNHGIETYQDAEKSVAETGRLNDVARRMLSACGIKGMPSKRARSFVAEMEKKGFSDDVIIHCAKKAEDVEKPMAYMRKMMENFSEKGIRTMEEIDRQILPEAEKRQKGKVVTEQNYTQREYTGSNDMPKWIIEEMEKMNNAQ